MDLLKTGSAWLTGQLKASAARSVTYKRGDESVSLLVMVGRTDFEVFDNETAMLTRVESRDFLFPAADLVIDDAQVLPERGDLIVEVGDDGKSRTYEVMAPAPRTAHYRWSDPYHERLRVHSKLTKVEEDES